MDFRRLNKQLLEVRNMSGSKGCISLVPLPKINELMQSYKAIKCSALWIFGSGYYHIDYLLVVQVTF